ncbi:hypothetical protein [Flavobacterium sp.]|uniref:hypothetical protein n=1 Tax=Flavobacterium sp. TaxID=239 RepID=UPI00352886AE
MMLAQKNQNIYQIFYFLCIAVTYLNNYELTFFVWGLTFLLTIRKTYSLQIIKLILPFILILFVATIISFFEDYKLFYKIRDLTYLSKPILGLLVGYQLFRRKDSLSNAWLKLINVGLIIALVHLAIAFFVIIKNKSFYINDIRAAGGYFSDYEIYILILLIFKDKFKINITTKKRNLLLLIIGLSSFLYLSRTNFLQLIILYLGIKGYLILTKKSIKVFLITTISVLIGYSAILYYNPKRQGTGLDGFLYKMKNAPIEPFKTKIDKGDWKDFNDNYRSYENIITVKQVSYNGFWAIMFGEGLGSRLNLGRKVLSNDGEYVQFIPYVHNAYMTVFLKSGILGVVLLIYFIFLLYKTGKRFIKQNEIPIGNLLIGSSIFLILSNWVFLGFYLKLDNKSILIGFIIAIAEQLVKNKKTLDAK